MNKTIRLSDHELKSVELLAKGLGISGQRDTTLSPLIRAVIGWYESAPAETIEHFTEIMKIVETRENMAS